MPVGEYLIFQCDELGCIDAGEVLVSEEGRRLLQLLLEDSDLLGEFLRLELGRPSQLVPLLDGRLQTRGEPRDVVIPRLYRRLVLLQALVHLIHDGQAFHNLLLYQFSSSGHI